MAILAVALKLELKFSFLLIPVEIFEASKLDNFGIFLFSLPFAFARINTFDLVLQVSKIVQSIACGGWILELIIKVCLILIIIDPSFDPHLLHDTICSNLLPCLESYSF